MTDANATTDRDTFDVAKQEVAQLYARSFMAAASDAGQSAVVLGELDAVVDEALAPFPQFEAVLASAVITGEQKVGIIDRAFGGRVSQLTLNFLKVLAEQGRLDALRAIRVAAHQVQDELLRRVRVHVTTAVPLDAATERRLIERLRGMVGGEPLLVREVDPAILGGLKIRIGDTVYDGAIATQLEHIRSRMIHRSVHEIQSRRDRFSPSEGN